MGVVGTRLPPGLGLKVLEHCRGLGKTPSEWLRELIEKELAGKMPSPAVGDAIQRLDELINDNTALVGTILAVAAGTYKALVQIEMVNHADTAKQIEQIDREFRAWLLENIPAKEQLTIEMGFRVSDLTSEIERIKGEKQIQRRLP